MLEKRRLLLVTKTRANLARLASDFLESKKKLQLLEEEKQEIKSQKDDLEGKLKQGIIDCSIMAPSIRSAWLCQDKLEKKIKTLEEKSAHTEEKIQESRQKTETIRKEIVAADYLLSSLEKKANS